MTPSISCPPIVMVVGGPGTLDSTIVHLLDSQSKTDCVSQLGRLFMPYVMVIAFTIGSGDRLMTSMRRFVACSVASGLRSPIGRSRRTSANWFVIVGVSNDAGRMSTGTYALMLSALPAASDPCARKYSPNAPARQHTSTSLTVAPVALPMRLTTSSSMGSDHDTRLSPLSGGPCSALRSGRHMKRSVSSRGPESSAIVERHSRSRAQNRPDCSLGGDTSTRLYISMRMSEMPSASEWWTRNRMKKLWRPPSAAAFSSSDAISTTFATTVDDIRGTLH